MNSPLTKAIDWLGDRISGVPRIHVPGNRCFWWDGDDRYARADQIALGRDLAARRDIHPSSDDAITLHGVKFLGSTLWTDLRLATGSPSHAARTARLGMRDYKRIRRPRSRRQKYVRPANTAAMHQAGRTWLDDRLGLPHDGPTVVAMHHAPRPRSLPTEGFDLAHCYASDLSRLIHDSQPDL